MLVMHEWLFSEVFDDEYWPEYVNLCITTGRVKIAKNVNALIPVTLSELQYPDDAPCSTELILSLFLCRRYDSVGFTGWKRNSVHSNRKQCDYGAGRFLA